ncbi:hypothetical protein SARC_07790 [Sphaeroforma arctica JP610]|uniref:Uncharacterized protein n=1 Tax=Sphaeroforma arctica JP610 TaxID=667725 RepID=A0A0L0FSS0_9EUKA|nr:hypothetical protein SARC_07790 [Sphaeroforma arctica JP610]KNC79830.1 hypothetical protein SARC_07790 [Sphaeroforma arctica JP610]|eukprot:XP_014153732.1 hypothetical protein SARC_07790 [Sphaeroforma arctica JP610]
MAVTELTRLEIQGIIRKCQESEAYPVHQALMILKSDGLRARRILNPESFNSHVEKKNFRAEGLERLAQIARSGNTAMSADIKDGFYALAVENPRLWQFRDHTGQLWFSPAWFNLLMNIMRKVLRTKGICIILLELADGKGYWVKPVRKLQHLGVVIDLRNNKIRMTDEFKKNKYSDSEQ